MYNKHNNLTSLSVILVIAMAIVFCVVCMRGCSSQNRAFKYGGTEEVTLEPNRKLVEITWKGNALWYLTREMRPNEVAEDYIFQEKDVTGWLEGTVIIHEVKLSDEEYTIYKEQEVLKEDYNKAGNLIYDNDYNVVEVYIKYENDKYIKIKNYKVDENGGLIPDV